MTDYLNKRQLKSMLGISNSTIQRKLKDLPRIKLGNDKNSRVLFPRPDIDDYIRKNFLVTSAKQGG